MSTALLLAASLLTITVSILSVQLPRYFKHLESKNGRDDSTTRPITAAHPARKPWDPPFPKPAKHSDKEETWLVIPPALTRHGHTYTDGADEANKRKDGEKQQTGDPMTKDAGTIMPLIWNILVILACLSLVCLFVLLVAHSLASFIVYKTEARLGEARRGVIQGGEMRLCLCARG